MESNVKSLTITGTAAEDATRFRQKGSRRKRVKEQEEEVPSDSQFIEQVKKISLVKVAPVTHAVTQSSQATHNQTQAQQTQAPMKPQVQQPQVQQPQVQQPQAPSNVILKPLKQPRVKLQPKSIHAAAASRPIDTTRKARKIHLSVGNLNHRFTRAKRLKDDTEKKPMSSIREYLVGKGVIQQKSKAPEKMLRSMYSDFMLLKDQAL
jgi:hypothetical protein